MTRLLLSLVLAGFVLVKFAPVAEAGFGTFIVITSAQGQDPKCNDKHHAVRC